MDKTDRVLKQFSHSQVVVTASPIISGMIIPNHSGIASNLDAQNKLVMATAGKLYLDRASDSYFQYNSGTGEIELYKNGVLIQAW